MRRDELDVLSGRIIAAAIAVHRYLGPGLLESAYQACIIHELRLLGLRVECQQPIPLFYKGVRLDCSYRLDLIVEGSVIVEVKAVERIDPIHVAQVLTYLRLTGHQLALLINFNVPVLKDGIRRVVLNLPESPRSSASSASPR